MIRRRAPAALALALLLIGGCSRDAPEQAVARPEPIVVYAARDADTGWSTRFAAFTRDTGVPVTVRNVDGVVEAVIANRGSPPADVLLAPDVAGIVRAADEGGLRLLSTGPLGEAIEMRMPAALRDPEGFWFAVSARVAAIAYRPDRVAASDLAGFEGLADARFRDQLCLSSSSTSVNRLLIATLISELGNREAEVAVRGWIANLARPVFDSEQDLMRAIGDGRCSVAVVALPAGSAGESVVADGAITTYLPLPVVADVAGIGIARHARSPDASRRLLEWLLPRVSALPDAASIANGNVAAAAWRIDDAARLAARAGYR